MRRTEAFILVCYVILSIGMALTGRPQTDESVNANPGYNMLRSGQMSTTLYEMRGFTSLTSDGFRANTLRFGSAGGHYGFAKSAELSV